MCAVRSGDTTLKEYRYLSGSFTCIAGAQSNIRTGSDILFRANS